MKSNNSNNEYTNYYSSWYFRSLLQDKNQATDSSECNRSHTCENTGEKNQPITNKP